MLIRAPSPSIEARSSLSSFSSSGFIASPEIACDAPHIVAHGRCQYRVVDDDRPRALSKQRDATSNGIRDIVVRVRRMVDRVLAAASRAPIKRGELAYQPLVI
jgi:hypothetical protein